LPTDGEAPGFGDETACVAKNKVSKMNRAWLLDRLT
jgi:hypothetical protein